MPPPVVIDILSGVIRLGVYRSANNLSLFATESSSGAEVKGLSFVPGTVAHPNTNYFSHQWLFTCINAQSGLHKIQSISTGLFLTAPQEIGNDVQLRPSTDSLDQQWTVIRGNTFQSALGDQVLERVADEGNPGAVRVITKRLQEATQQEWTKAIEVGFYTALAESEARFSQAPCTLVKYNHKVLYLPIPSQLHRYFIQNNNNESPLAAGVQDPLAYAMRSKARFNELCSSMIKAANVALLYGIMITSGPPPTGLRVFNFCPRPGDGLGLVYFNAKDGTVLHDWQVDGNPAGKFEIVAVIY